MSALQITWKYKYINSNDNKSFGKIKLIAMNQRYKHVNGTTIA